MNTADSVIGSVGTPDGRTDFTVMGNVVKVTARLRARGKPIDVFVLTIGSS